jgi:hypothetical protein
MSEEVQEVSVEEQMVAETYEHKPEPKPAPKKAVKREVPKPLEMIFRKGMEYDLEGQRLIVDRVDGLRVTLRRV